MAVHGTRFRRGGIGVVTTILLAILGTSLAMASSSQAAITVGQSVGKFRLGYSKAKVRRLNGKPTTANTYSKSGETVWRYIGQLATISFKHGRLNGIVTYSRSQRTSKGIGPGSSYAATTGAYPQAECDEGTFGPEARTCTLDTTFGGHKVRTDFVFYKEGLPMREVDIEQLSPEN